MKPKWAKKQCGKKKIIPTIHCDPGSKHEDKSKVSIVGIKCIISNVNTCSYSSNKSHDEKERDDYSI